jgi:hypothetical protein
MKTQATIRNFGLKALVALASLSGAGLALAHHGDNETLAGANLLMHLWTEHVFWPLMLVLVVGGFLLRNRRGVSS